jgi:hypothetical protein
MFTSARLYSKNLEILRVTFRLFTSIKIIFLKYQAPTLKLFSFKQIDSRKAIRISFLFWGY